MVRWSVLGLLAAAATGGLAAQEPVDHDGAVVRGVLFYSPTCPHCQEVMNVTLPPILEAYDGRVQVAAINTMTPGGQALFRSMIDALVLPRERIGVPTLLLGRRTLVGDVEIPTLLPQIADSALARDGIDWPDIPLIRQALVAQGLASRPGAGATGAAEGAAMPDTAEEAGPREVVADEASPEEAVAAATGATPDETSPERAAEHPVEEPRSDPADVLEAAAPAADAAGPEGPVGDDPAPSVPVGPPDAELAAAFEDAVHELSLQDRLMLDPVGNGAAIAVLVLMLVALGLALADRAGALRVPPWPGWSIPVLLVLGIGVASYLAWVDVTGTDAVCGPVGDCNTVQQSAYARLFGVIPVGALGVAGYVTILVAWLAGRVATGRPRRTGRAAVWVLALVAVLFSVYLTFLEPFVIGASCAWCLSSAAVSTLILLAATAEWRDEAAVSEFAPQADPRFPAGRER